VKKLPRSQKNSTDDAGRKRALELALWYLSKSARTVHEIEVRLTRKEYSAENVGYVVKKLKDLNFLNDEEYAKNFIRNAKLGKPKGRHRIKLELIKKGVDKELIDLAIEEGFTEGEQEELIDSAAKIYLKKIQNLPREKIYNRLMGYLLRRGFDYGKVSVKVKEILKDL